MKIHWSAIAEADLDDIYDYIARDVISTATKICAWLFGDN